jgi:hypothetical protein
VVIDRVVDLTAEEDEDEEEDEVRVLLRCQGVCVVATHAQLISMS